MTTDEFRARYALLEQIADGGVRTFHAVTPTGGVVMVHFVDGGITPANLALLSALERLDPERRANVREVTAVDGSIAIVSSLLPGFATLPAWLGLDAAAGPTSAPVAPSSKPVDAAALAASPSVAAPPAEPIAEGTGQAAGDSADAPVEPIDAPGIESVDAPAVEPDATVEFIPPAADADPPTGDATTPIDPPAVESASAPTEPGPLPPAIPAVSETPAPAAAPAPGPGEFTRIFLAANLSGAPAFTLPEAASAEPKAASPPTAPVVPPIAPAEPKAASPALVPPIAPAPPEPTPAASEPGEFTRLFRAAALAPSASPPSEAPAAEAPPPVQRNEPAPATIPDPPPAPQVPPAVERREEMRLPEAPFRGDEVRPSSPREDEMRLPTPPADPVLPDAPLALPEASALFRAFAAPAAAPEPDASPGFAPVPPPPLGGAAGGASGVFSAPVPPPAAPDAGAAGGGEFSRLFQRLELPAWAVPPDAAGPPSAGPPAPEPLRYEREPEPAPADDYLDRLYSSPEPRPAYGADPHPAEAPGPPLSAFPPAFSPLGAPPAPFAAAPAPAAPPARPAPPAPAGSTTPLLVGLAIILVLAVALILFFVLR